ncbi:transposon Ty3-I Gag-Pol polyprotein [Trichonephila clavipes]|nr:transposon Ty3-I Gag-Pol polyprotein [Trichonephila clavipes]
MPTEQEAKPAVVTPSLQQWRSPSTFRGAPGEDPLKWLKEYWYVNNEDALDSWEAFKNGLSGLFGDRQRYTRRAEEQLKCRAQRSGESTQSYIQSVLGLCQERERLSLTTLETPTELGDVGTEEEIRRPNSSRRFTPSPTRGRSPIRRYRSPSPIADPVSRQAVGARKTKQSDLPRSRFWASFSVISDKYRRFLKKVLFADAKSVMLKVADGNFVRPIGKCVLRVRINNRELPFEFIVLSHCSHDVILGWDF